MKQRVYVDTSVFGGIFDVEFESASKIFFAQVRKRKFSLVISALIREELSEAPQEVKDLFNDLLPFAEIIDITTEALELREAYLRKGVLTAKYSADALHVALATTSRCSLVVSWNFRHIVHFDKIAQYNAVNVIKGYSPVAIFSPQEVIHYD